MSTEVKLWAVDGAGELKDVPRRPLDLEGRLEEWLERDISILSQELLVIGRQVETEYGGYIDLLCLDPNGDSVIVELKRDRTPRDVTAQALDYAAWVRGLSHERISQIADGYFAKRRTGDLNKAFRERFGTEVPEVLNEDHSLLIVGSAIDPQSERIIQYLSEDHGVRINATTFSYFTDPTGREYVARVFLLEPEAVEQRSNQKGTSKRRATPSFEEFEAVATRNGVGEPYRALHDGLRGLLHPYTMVTSVAFYARLEGSSRAIFSLLPEKSSTQAGLAFQVYLWRLARLTGHTPEYLTQALPAAKEPWKYTSNADQDSSGYAGYFRTREEAQHFVAMVNAPRASEVT